MSLLGNMFGRKEGKTTDPVCRMEVNPAKTQWSSTHAGASYYFCSKACKESFDADPAKYAGAPSPSATHGHHS
jgi:Cu+-exporting ATPase